MKYLTVLIFLSTLAGSALAQSTITGIVIDEAGEPLIGATVQIKGTTDGSITDLDGNFTVLATPGDILVISMVGMDSKEVIAKVSPLQVKLSEAASVLGEVVVTGFQQVDRKLFTGASESLSMKDIQLAGTPDVSRSLEGQVAGVTVDNVSGTFGSTPKIRIRGNASLNGNNQPLFVVDGVILEDLSNVNTEDFLSGDASTLVSSSIANLNPDDIESFQVLMDASATAIYGARAANGVIVITTKRGRSGQLRVNYSGNYTFQLRPTYNQFSLLNSAEEMSVYRELHDKGLLDITTSARAQNYGALGKMYVLIANHELDWGPNQGLNNEFLEQYENTNTDWFDVLFRDAGLQQQHSVSFTAGNDKSNSYYSISYLHDQGQTIADRVQRVTGSARNTYFLSDIFTFGLKLTASYRQQKVPGTRNREFDPLTGRFSRSFDINPFSYSLNTARSIRPYDENGDLEYFRRNYAPFNILKELEYNFMDIQVSDFSAQTDYTIKPWKGFSVNGVLQARHANTIQDHTVHERSNQSEAYRAAGTQFIQDANNLLFNDPDNPGLNPTIVLPQGGFNYLDQTELLSFYSRVSADYNKTFGEDHEINVLAGQEIRFAKRNQVNTTGLGVIYESGGIVVTEPNIIEFFNLQDIDYYGLSESNDRFLGLFLNGGYAYKQKYIANFTVRYDGSNQLGKSRKARYLPTWNVSGAWNVSNESFINMDWLDDLKLRATYGISGNLPEDASALLNIQSDVTIRPDDVEPLLFIQDLTNNSLTWEKLKEFNVGMDLSLFDEKISTTMNYYLRNSFDLIGTVQTSGIGGQGLKAGNFADMEIQGFDFSISSKLLKIKDFTWNANFNIGYTRDKITKLDFGAIYAQGLNQNGAGVIGRPRRSIYSARFAGLDTKGIPAFYDGDGEPVYEIDLQQRDSIESVLKYEGSAEPQGAGGLINTFKYKGLSLMVMLSYKFGYKIRLNDAFFSRYTDFDALPGELVNRWAVPGDEAITNIPAIVDREEALSRGDISQAYQLYNKSTVRMADGSYVRLRTVRLSYQVPGRWVDRLKVSSAQLSLEAQNLALLYADKRLNGQDPEFFSAGGVALPQPKMITFSLSVGF